MKCKSCKYWKRTKKGSNYGLCSSPKFQYKGDMENGDDVFYEDAHRYQVAIFMGENFGCIHFEKK